MTRPLILTAALLLFCVTLLVAEETEDVAADTAQVMVDTTTLPSHPPDSLVNADSGAATVDNLPSDSLTFEQRLERYRKTLVRRKPRLSAHDSLVAYFVSERLNQDPQRRRSFYHDAGDYFKFDPSYFIIDNQFTPGRKTVQPFALPGPRLDFIINGQAMRPFEHIVEPDGLADLNDIPTAFDEGIYVIPGAAGMLLGADQTFASLVSEPQKPDDSVSHTSLLGEEGDLGWSWVRGRYTRNFPSGREGVASVEYREGDGRILGAYDDSYNYLGDFYFPLGMTWGARTSGQAYRRQGRLWVEPLDNGPAYQRFRREFRGDVSIEKNNRSFDTRMAVGYRFTSQASTINDIYRAHHNRTEHTGYLEMTKLFGSILLQAEAEVISAEYDNWYDRMERSHGRFTIKLARLKQGLNWALVGGGRYDDDFQLRPFGSLVITRDTNRSYFLFSAGYAERVPTLYERFLRFRRLAVYSVDTDDYAEVGNADLTPEKQFTGSLTYEYGSRSTALRLSVTGGRITDAIGWFYSDVVDSAGTPYRQFRPENSDVEFYDLSASERLQLGPYLNLRSGVSMHSVSYSDVENPPYTPEFQTFAGLELHIPWQRRKVDLYGYGEVQYVGAYDGYHDLQLGDYALINARASLVMGRFRFFSVWQNITNQVYRMRDFTRNAEIFFYYGIAWHFLE